MKSQKTKVDRHGKEHASNLRIGRQVYKDDPIPTELLEKPSDAKMKLWKESEMPSDFWL